MTEKKKIRVDGSKQIWEEETCQNRGSEFVDNPWCALITGRSNMMFFFSSRMTEKSKQQKKKKEKRINAKKSCDFFFFCISF